MRIKTKNIFSMTSNGVNKNGQKTNAAHNLPRCSPLLYSKIGFYFLGVLQHTVFVKSSYEAIARETQICFFGVPDWEGGREKRGKETSSKSPRKRKHNTESESGSNTDESDS